MTIKETWLKQNRKSDERIQLFFCVKPEKCDECNTTIHGGIADLKTGKHYCKQCAETIEI